MSRRLGGDGGWPDAAPLSRTPVNAIWEGSGNVQCLDIARALQRSPHTLQAYFAEVSAVKGENAALDAPTSRRLRTTYATSATSTAALAIFAIASLSGSRLRLYVREGSPLAEAFCRSRIETKGAHNYGALTGIDVKAIVKRAAPRFNLSPPLEKEMLAARNLAGPNTSFFNSLRRD